MEEAAIQAVAQHPQEWVGLGKVVWETRGDFLFCTLPSGRDLAYPFPQVREKKTPWGEMRPQLTFMGIDKHHQWTRQHTYGGSLVENVVQAIARDLMAEATLRLEQGGVYAPILTVHDEILAEANTGVGDIKEFIALMAECPTWASGCPVAAEGWKGTRYRK